MTTVFGNPGSTDCVCSGTGRRTPCAGAAGKRGCGHGRCAQVTRRAAPVNLHSAGGVGHALGSVFTAYRNQTPLVIIAGQQTRAMLPTDPFLSARSAVEFPRPYVKWSIEPARGEDVPAAIAQAIHTALQRPCGPVFVSVPEDDWEVETEPVQPRQVNVQFAPDPGALDRLADALNSSRRPALVVGAVDQDGAWPLAIQPPSVSTPRSGEPDVRAPQLPGGPSAVRRFPAAAASAAAPAGRSRRGRGDRRTGVHLSRPHRRRFRARGDAALPPHGRSGAGRPRAGGDQHPVHHSAGHGAVAGADVSGAAHRSETAPAGCDPACARPDRRRIRHAYHCNHHAPECSGGRRSALPSQRAARVLSDPGERRVLRVRQRRPGWALSGGPRAAWPIPRAVSPARGRLQLVYHPGGCGPLPSIVPDYLRDSASPLCGCQIARRSRVSTYQAAMSRCDFRVARGCRALHRATRYWPPRWRKRLPRTSPGWSMSAWIARSRLY